jgi:hypothetical protein
VQVLNFKTGIDFGPAGNLKDFDPIGFSPGADDVSTWSEASLAELTFRLPPLRYDVRFTIEVFPFLANGLIAQQNCWVFFNGLFVHFQTIKAPVEMVFTVSREVFSPRANRLSFTLPNAAAPKDLEMGNDLRLLGLSFVKLSAGDASEAAPAPRREAEPPARAVPPPRVPETPTTPGPTTPGDGDTTRAARPSAAQRAAASAGRDDKPSPDAPGQRGTRDRGGASRAPQPGGRRSTP